MANHWLQEDVLQLWTAFQADQRNTELRNQMVESYWPLVKYHGERFWTRLPGVVRLSDLISAGAIGLMNAIDAYDLSRGITFETYCVPQIRGAMLDHLRAMNLQEAASHKRRCNTDVLQDKKGEALKKDIQKSDCLRLATKGLNRDERLLIILHFHEGLSLSEIGTLLRIDEDQLKGDFAVVLKRLCGRPEGKGFAL